MGAEQVFVVNFKRLHERLEQVVVAQRLAALVYARDVEHAKLGQQALQLGQFLLLLLGTIFCFCRKLLDKILNADQVGFELFQEVVIDVKRQTQSFHFIYYYYTNK